MALNMKCPIRLGCHHGQQKPRVAANASCTTSKLRSVSCKAAQQMPSFIPSIVSEIGDPAAQAMASSMRRTPIPLTTLGGIALDTAYVPPTRQAYREDAPAIVLLHSFDSSCLELRRLHPLLAEHAPTFAVDLVGWGFTDHSPYERDPSLPVSPAAKREHLRAFIETVVAPAVGAERPVIVLGTSVGGAVALDFALHHPEMLSKLVLIDAQAFIDGIGPMAKMPRFLAQLGVKVLKQEWLRQSANNLAYYDKAAYATKDALLVGRLHTHLPGWLDANVAFMQSGGYALSRRISRVTTETLVLWGRQDEILDPALYAERFERTLPRGRLVWVEQCGHSPHLEQPRFVAQQVLQFAFGASFQSDSETSYTQQESELAAASTR